MTEHLLITAFRAYLAADWKLRIQIAQCVEGMESLTEEEFDLWCRMCERVPRA